MRLVIFDFDGLILDTETPDYASWQETYAEYGVALPLEAWAHCIGAPSGVFDPVAYLEGLVGGTVDRQTIEETRRARFLELVNAQPLCEGVLDYLYAAREQGLQRAVASSATRDWVEGHLDRFGIREKFDCIRCVEDVAQGKPAPDLFVSVLEELAVAPRDALVVEDSPNGILAANGAGVYSVAVPNPVTRLLDLGHAKLQIESLQEWRLERLLEHVRNGACRSLK